MVPRFVIALRRKSRGVFCWEEVISLMLRIRIWHEIPADHAAAKLFDRTEGKVAGTLPDMNEIK